MSAHLLLLAHVAHKHKCVPLASRKEISGGYIIGYV